MSAVVVKVANELLLDIAVKNLIFMARGVYKHSSHMQKDTQAQHKYTWITQTLILSRVRSRDTWVRRVIGAIKGDDDSLVVQWPD